MHMILDSPWQLIKMRNLSSLTVTQTVTPTPWTAAPCGTGIPLAPQKGSRNHGSLSVRTEMATSPVTRTATNILTGDMRNPKRVITNMVQNGLVGTLHDAKTMTVSMAAIPNMRDRGHDSPSATATEQSRDTG